MRVQGADRQRNWQQAHGGDRKQVSRLPLTGTQTSSIMVFVTSTAATAEAAPALEVDVGFSQPDFTAAVPESAATDVKGGRHKRWRETQAIAGTVVTREQILGGLGVTKINSELLNHVARHRLIGVSVTRKPTHARPEGQTIEMIRDAVVCAWPDGVLSLTLE